MSIWDERFQKMSKTTIVAEHLQRRLCGYRQNSLHRATDYDMLVAALDAARRAGFDEGLR